MSPHRPGFEDLHDRLLNLEKQNRRLKQLVTVALVVVTSLLAIGHAPVRRTVEANEFILRDKGGHVRARLSINEPLDNPEMVFFGEKGKASVKLAGGFRGFGGQVIVSDEQGLDRGLFVGTANGASLSLPGVNLDSGSVKVTDAEGFDDALGTGELVTPRTGETHKTSAASLVLFAKDKTVIWRAP